MGAPPLHGVPVSHHESTSALPPIVSVLSDITSKISPGGECLPENVSPEHINRNKVHNEKMNSSPTSCIKHYLVVFSSYTADQVNQVRVTWSTQPGHRFVGRRNKYQLRLGR